jgi:hypothetical protein
MQQLINIQSLEDLKKVLIRQKLITRRAAEELAQITESLQVVEGDSEEVKTEKAFEFIAKERQLLDKYAKYPTLTEFNLMPNTADMAVKWGATFGVALIVGELILEQVKLISGAFDNSLSVLYTILLNELSNPRSDFMIDPLLRAIKIEIRPKDAVVTAEAQEVLKKQVVRQLAEVFVIVSVAYGIMQKHEDGSYSLTPTGHRVLLHLQDVQRFMALMATAHKKFQDEKPAVTIH